MSYKPEVIADSSGTWCGNALRFATEAEATANVLDLAGRWMAVRETRVVESDEPVNYAWVRGGLTAPIWAILPAVAAVAILGSCLNQIFKG